MRIGIDARMYGPETGIGRYLQKLIENLEKLDPQNEYFVFLRKNNWSRYRSANQHFKKILADFRWYSLEEQIKMPLKIHQTRVDLMHFPHFNVPLFYGGPFVVTIHDLILTRFPTLRATTLGPLLYLIKNLAYRLVIRSALRRAQKVITVSSYMKAEIIREFKLAENKVIFIYEGLTELRSGSYAPDKNILLKYNINKPYLLYVGNAYPHKNLERLLRAIKIVQKTLAYQLVLVGTRDYFYKRLTEEARKLKLYQADGARSFVIFTGRLSDQELAHLYQEASLYICPSLYEGFGLPALEAMFYRVPVVSSWQTALTEILGEAALYFNPNDTQSMAKTIIKALSKKPLRDYLINQGSQRIKKFSWARCAQETRGVYEKVAPKA